METVGIALEADYPYTSGTTGSKSADGCQDSSGVTDTKVASYVTVTPNNVDQMKAALAVTALSVSIEADKMVFQTY